MAYADELLTRLMGEPYWQLGLYLDGTDPMVDLGAAEVSGANYARVTLDSWTTPANTNPTTITPDADVTVSGLPACDIAGYFLIQTGANAAWYKVAFTAPVTVALGDMLVLTGGDIVITLETA